MPNYLVDATLCLSRAGRYRDFVEGRIATSLERNALNHAERWSAGGQDYVRWTLLQHAPTMMSLFCAWSEAFETWPQGAQKLAMFVQVAVRNTSYEIRQTLPPYQAA